MSSTVFAVLYAASQKPNSTYSKKQFIHHSDKFGVKSRYDSKAASSWLGHPSLSSHIIPTFPLRPGTNVSIPPRVGGMRCSPTPTTSLVLMPSVYEVALGQDALSYHRNFDLPILSLSRLNSRSGWRIPNSSRRTPWSWCTSDPSLRIVWTQVGPDASPC